VFSGPAKPFAKGQVFLSTDDGMVFVYNPDGSLAQVLNSTGLTQNPGNGLAFDPASNLYVANQGSALVELFGNQGAAPVAFGTGTTTPFSVVVDPSSNVFVGQTVSQGDKLLEYAGGKTGAPSSTFFPAYESDFSQAAWTELRSDGDTVLYTLGTKTVKAFDIGDVLQLPDVVTNLHGAFALRELPDQTVLVADTDRIVRLDLNGNVTQTYTIPGAAAVFFNLNLDPDGVTFWTDDQSTGTVYRLNIASGAVASQFNTPLGIATNLASSGIGGIAVSGAQQAGAGADLGVSMTAAPNPVAAGSSLAYSITVTNNGPDAAQSVAVTDGLPAGVTFVSATASTGSCSGTTTVTCNLGTFANAATATITIVVTPTAAGTLTNTANVTSTTPDPVTANNSATTSTTVTGSSAPATHFSVTAPASATAGTAFNVTVTALTASNTTATGYTSTVHFTSTDAQAVLPADSTLTNGTGMFAVTLKTAGAQMIIATDTMTATITGTSGTITVASTAATHFSVTSPASATAGTAFNVTVTALTASNTTATGYTGTVHFTSTDAQAVLPADSTLTNGTGMFAVTLKTAGAQMVIATDTVTATITGSATATVTTTATLKSIAVTPATATIAVNGTQQFTATGTFSDNSTKDVTTQSTWKSSNAEVATVGAGTGLATGVGVGGPVTITATDGTVSGTASLTVSNTPIKLTINPPPGGAFPPVAPGGTLPVGVVLTANPGTTGTVTFSCTTSSPTITCSPQPSSVTLSTNGPLQIAFVVETFCKGPTTTAGHVIPGGFGGGIGLLLLSLMVAGTTWMYRRNPRWAVSFALFVVIALGGVACNSLPRNPNGVTVPGNYQLFITATFNGQTVTAPAVNFVVD
jgi:predicted RNA methylase